MMTENMCYEMSIQVTFLPKITHIKN